MSEHTKVTPKDFFLWVGAMAALYFSVGSFIILSFEYIERLVGTTAVIGYDPYSDSIRFAIASLIVLFPVYVIITRMLQGDIRNNPEKKNIWVRKWLIFLTIFGSAIALVIDLIVLINTFLAGEELTTAFLLKIAVAFIVFGGVFYYYLQDVRGVWEQNEQKSKFIGMTVSAIVIISIISGFFIMGSPQTQRLLRYDDQRINDLKNIQAQVTEYYRTKEELPEFLESLEDPLVMGYYIESDPETGEDYEYSVIDSLTFELCATFSLPLTVVDETKADKSDWRVRDLQQTARDWTHEGGLTCFERTIDPERYPELIYPLHEKVRS